MVDIEHVEIQQVSKLDTGTLFFISLVSARPLLCISAMEKGPSGDNRIVIPLLFPDDDASVFTAFDESVFSDLAVVLNDTKVVVDKQTLNNGDYTGATRGMIFADGASLFVRTFYRGMRGKLLNLHTGLLENNLSQPLVSFDRWRIQCGEDDPETIAEFIAQH